ncbi:AfsR/SARP family transcriptional regulator [Candidatus Leptofilum sp.]|uniref:AfsR/SARP family transcriptional regulator n=1 Tax=Candidatus Leptofilum sp. TaxID=3241576 RepID=UPI003B5A4FDC
MSSLQIALFDGIQVQFDDQPITLAYDKVRALLAYLLIEANQPQRRERLVGLLWPEQPEKEARHSLSQALLKLRQAIDPNNDMIIANRHTVGLNPAAQFELDTAVFTTHLLQCQTHQHAQPNLCESCMEWRETAVSIYKGPFLVGLSLPDAPQFEQWLTQQREQYHRQMMSALTTLATYHEQVGEFTPAIKYAQQQLMYEPWLEETHRQLMRLFARAGQRSLALKQYEQCCVSLHEELNTDVSPETKTLRNQIKLRPNFSLQNLPLAPTPFIGRKQELTTLRDWLSDKVVRLITITGIGGMGKTRLALAVTKLFLHPKTAQPMTPFADGIYFIDLVPLTAPDQIETAVAEVLHLQLTMGNGRSPRQQLLDYLSGKQMLLLFDNFEHLLPGATFISELLQVAPNLSIIVTSRTRLRLRGEKVLALSGLAYHRDDATSEANSFDNDAVQMFLSTATQIEPELNPSQDEMTQINEICRMVEGSPLAVELAARWVDTLPLGSIASGIKEDIDRLATDLQDLPPRQRSITAVFQSSWQRLPESAGRVMARASVFQGGFTLDAAITIMGATHQTLALLVNHSLLQFDQLKKRYYTHELLRQFAATKLATNHELEYQTQRKHLKYYYELAKEGEMQLRGGDPISWMNRLRSEKGNWVVALEWAFNYKLELAAQLAIHLSLYWTSSGQIRVGQQFYEKLIRKQMLLLEETRGWLFTRYSSMLWKQGRISEGKEIAEEAIKLFQRREDGSGIAMSYYQRAAIAFYEGELELSGRYCEKALAIAHEDINVPNWFLTLFLQAQSTFLAEVGRDEEANDVAYRCLKLCQENNNLIAQSYAMATLARIAIRSGNLPEADSFCKQALAIAQDLNDQRMEAIQYLILGNISLAKRDFFSAVNQLETAMAFGKLLGSNDILDEAMMLLGRDAYTGIGDYELAFQALQRWAKICLQLNNESNMVACLEKMADVHWRLNSGNLKSVRWLATAAAWRDVAENSSEAELSRQLLKKIQAQLLEADFRQSWQAGLSVTLRAALAEAASPYW